MSNRWYYVILIIGSLSVGRLFAEEKKEKGAALADRATSSIEKGKPEWGLLGGIGSSHVNFTPQIDFGLTFSSDRKRVYSFEYRLHHISNANTAGFNPGVNSSFFQFGMSLFR